MTISVLTTVMSSDGKSESSHELNFFLDKQLQSRLLEQDEILVASELLAQITGGADGKFSGTKTNFNSKNDALVGWVTDSKVPLRRPEKESAKNVNQNNSTSWRDNRYKQQTVQIQDNYVFKHYADTHGYIEQYRRDHTNVYGLKAAGFQALQGARQYMTQSVTPSQIHAQQQNNMCNCCNNAVSNLNSYITAALHYTNRAGYSLLSPGNYSGSNSANSCSHSTSNNQNHSHSSHSCSKHKNHVDLASQAYKYKLSPETMWNIRSESQNSLESDRTLDMKTPRINSAKGRQAGKTPTKVTVPVSAQMQAKQPPQQVPIQGTQTKPNESTTTPSSNGIRTLDTLACVATDKQRYRNSRPFSSTSNILQVRSLGHVLMDSSSGMRGRTILRPATVATAAYLQQKSQLSENGKVQYIQMSDMETRVVDAGTSVSEEGEEVIGNHSDDSDAISMSRLSTTCLGAEVRVKGDSSSLEPSCAYHVFPNDQMLENSITVLNTKGVNWCPAISTPPPPTRHKIKKEFTFHTPFKEKITVLSVTSPRTFCETPTKTKFVQPKVDFPIINKDSKGMLTTSDANSGKETKQEERKKSADTQGQGGKENKYEPPKSRSCAESKAKQMKNLRQKYAGYLMNTRGKMQKAKSASTCDSSTDQTQYSVKNYPNDQSGIKDNLKVDKPYPILQYWNSEESFRESKSAATSCRSSKQPDVDDESLKKVAQYLLSESNILVDHEKNNLSKLHQDLELSDGKKEDVIPNTESLTWCEKLELLRAVNKPKERPKIKPPKLKFYKDSDSPPAPIVREATRAQLYEQRRIKHLLQQVRMKGSNNFDWLTKDDDNLNTKSTEDSDDSDSTSSSDEEVADQHPRNIRKGIDISHAEGAILSRYNMKSVVKRQGFKGVPFFTRTNTEVYQD